MTKKRKFSLAAVLAIATTAGGGYALGVNAPLVLNSDSTFYACVTGVNGNITKVTNTPKSCPRGSTAISWNSMGPVGPSGAKGEKGDRGEQGSPGLPGSAASGSGLNSYLVGPDGQEFQLISIQDMFNLGQGSQVVSINGHLWLWSGNSVLPVPLNGINISIYKNQGCALESRLAGGYNPLPIGNAAYSVSALQSSSGYQVQRDKNSDIEDFKSFKDWSGCHDFDFAYYSDSFKKWAQNIKEVLSYLTASEDLESYSIRTDYFSSCSITVTRYSRLVEPSAETYNFENCLKSQSDYNDATQIINQAYNNFQSYMSTGLTVNNDMISMGWISGFNQFLDESVQENLYSYSSVGPIPNINLWKTNWKIVVK